MAVCKSVAGTVVYLLVLHVPVVVCSVGISKALTLGGIYMCMRAAISFYVAGLFACCAPAAAVADVACLACPPAMGGFDASRSAGIPGGDPQASLRADSTQEGPAQWWCRGFFYRITVIMGQEAIMRLTDARGYVVGTSQVSTCSFGDAQGLDPSST